MIYKRSIKKNRLYKKKLSKKKKKTNKKGGSMTYSTKHILVGIDYGGLLHKNNDLDNMEYTSGYLIYNADLGDLDDIKQQFNRIKNFKLQKQVKQILLKIITFNALFVTLLSIILKNNINSDVIKDIIRQDRINKIPLTLINYMLKTKKDHNIEKLKDYYEQFLELFSEFNSFIKKPDISKIIKFNSFFNKIKDKLLRLNINFFNIDGDEEKVYLVTSINNPIKVSKIKCSEPVKKKWTVSICTKCSKKKKKCKTDYIKKEINEDYINDNNNYNSANEGYNSPPKNNNSNQYTKQFVSKKKKFHPIEHELNLIDLFNKSSIHIRPNMVAASVYVKNKKMQTYFKKSETLRNDSNEEIVIMPKVEYELIEFLNKQPDFNINILKNKLINLIFDLFNRDFYFTDLKPENLMITNDIQKLNYELLPHEIKI